jgi:GMP synthase-like glutamine amidotransferase
MRINKTRLVVATVLFAGPTWVRCEATLAFTVPWTGEASASTTAPNSSAQGAIDGDRFALRPGMFWKGAGGAKTWWWQLRFAEPRPVGAILQVQGDQPSILANAPRRYRWQTSLDGRNWQDLPETEVRRERRLYRLHRLVQAVRATYLRLRVDECLGEAPSLREVEVYPDPSVNVEFGDWIIAVSTTTQDRRLPGFTSDFARLVRECPGWEKVLMQQVWLGDVDESFVAAEPNPLCVLLSGNTLEWCQQEQEPWRGIQEVLKNRHLPIWAACGGAQALAILQETGVDKPWDCPRCRNPKAPKLPVYSHIGHTGPAKCSDYSKNVWERGKYQVRAVARDPVFQGLSEVFEVMESHVGQVAYLPKGWVRLATKGPGALTENQCLRLADRYVYAAQFHIEMAGTPENSRRIMGNFLGLAKAWGGYNPRGKPVPRPEPRSAGRQTRPVHNRFSPDR